MRESKMRAGSIGVGREHGALVECGGAVQPWLERGVQLVDAGFGEEPRLPKLTPRIGMSRPDCGDPRGHAEQRAVAAQDDDQIDLEWQVVAGCAS